MFSPLSSLHVVCVEMLLLSLIVLARQCRSGGRNEESEEKRCSEELQTETNMEKIPELIKKFLKERWWVFKDSFICRAEHHGANGGIWRNLRDQLDSSDP
ncbi:hypothetical protein CRENBAI_009341 [Crenichthys baileyi]|uniref:Secreted protein n=1 Tax=Crenichthys baileyi TaxID=28760 RepID=A0AAV9RME1_9TELE